MKIDLGGVPAHPENHAPRPLDGCSDACRRSDPQHVKLAAGQVIGRQPLPEFLRFVQHKPHLLRQYQSSPNNNPAR